MKPGDRVWVRTHLGLLPGTVRPFEQSAIDYHGPELARRYLRVVVFDRTRGDHSSITPREDVWPMPAVDQLADLIRES